MSHFGNFMDGVSVKISEKYKRPPRIELPYFVYECPQRAQNVIDNVKYCCTLEKKVLSKVKELRSAKETKKNERRHRLQLLEEAKQRKIDAIAAAEAEEKLKQLSVSEVSYPSTDEISAISPDEKVERDKSTPTPDNSPEIPEGATAGETGYPTNNNGPESQLNILQPIPAHSNHNLNNLLDDPDPLHDLKINMKVTKIPQYSNIDTLTYKDFENDTSSPFDNVELKTINEMELLAQVLQSQKDSATGGQLQTIAEHENYGIPNSASQAQIDGYMPSSYIEQSIQGPGIMYSSHHSSQAYPNGYYMPTENVHDNVMPLESVNMYMPNYQYYIQGNPYGLVAPNYYYNQLPVNSESSQMNDSMYIPQPYYYQYQHMPQHAPVDPDYNIKTPDLDKEKPSASTSQNTIKSRSRSVPDIIKELNEEVESAKVRVNERSCNASPAPKIVPAIPSVSKKNSIESRKRAEELIDPYSSFPTKLQEMCKRIHTMGFPLARVARVCHLVGDSDKKIIECLLILGELMDLGFSEDKASKALVKHEFNRDKALDELVS